MLKNIFLVLEQSDVVVILLINVKMPIIDGNLTFKSKINFMLSSVKHEKRFYNFRACHHFASKHHIYILVKSSNRPRLFLPFSEKL